MNQRPLLDKQVQCQVRALTCLMPFDQCGFQNQAPPPPQDVTDLMDFQDG